MVRRHYIHPDQIRVLHDGREVAEVSDQGLAEGLLKLVPILQIGGGAVSIVSGRQSTGLPGEMYTTNVVFQWADRTDSDPIKGAERAVEVMPPEPEPEPEQSYAPDPPYENPDLEAMRREVEAQVMAEAEPHNDPHRAHHIPTPEPRLPVPVPDDVGDGLVLTRDEDLSSIPAEQR